MLRITDIQSALSTLVGWEQDYSPDRLIQDELTMTDSGLTYQQAHPLLTLENIRSVMPEDNNVYPTWNATTVYKRDNIVTKGGVQYIAVRDSVNVDPSSDPYNNSFGSDFDLNAHWREYDQTSEFLRKEVKRGITEMVNRFVETKSIEKSSKRLLEHKCFFDGAGRMTNRIDSRHCLVGYEIECLKGVGVTTQLHRVGLQFVGQSGNVTVYLMHSSKSSPVASWQLQVSGNGTYQWFNLQDIYLRYMDGVTNAGGCWYICYHQDGMPQMTSAVNVSKDFSQEPCQYCNSGSVYTWRTMMKYMRVSPFRVSVDSGWRSNPTMFDIDDIEYTPSICYGMNLELSIGCDLTDFIISNANMFASVLQKQVAYGLLKRIAFNPEANVNRNQANVQRQEYILELDGNNYTKSSGLRGELERAYKSIEIDTEGIDQVCLPCGKRGVRYGLA